MRRKVKRTLKVHTTETWTITWRGDVSADQAPRSPRRRRPKRMALPDTLPSGAQAEGEAEHDATTTPSQPVEGQSRKP